MERCWLMLDEEGGVLDARRAKKGSFTCRWFRLPEYCRVYYGNENREDEASSLWPSCWHVREEHHLGIACPVEVK